MSESVGAAPCRGGQNGAVATAVYAAKSSRHVGRSARGLCPGVLRMRTPPFILVADDDLDSNFLFKHALSIVAPEVRASYLSDGRAALDLLQGKRPADNPEWGPPDLLLLDLKMPRTNGFEVLEFLRQNPPLRPRLVIVFTCSSHPDDIGLASHLGADHYLVKPMALEDLIELVRILVGYCYDGQRLVPGGTSRGVRGVPNILF